MESDLFWALFFFFFPTSTREEVFQGTKEKLKAGVVWGFFLFSVAIQGIFPSFVSGITVLVIVNVNERQWNSTIVALASHHWLVHASHLPFHRDNQFLLIGCICAAGISRWSC